MACVTPLGLIEQAKFAFWWEYEKGLGTAFMLDGNEKEM